MSNTNGIRKKHTYWLRDDIHELIARMSCQLGEERNGRVSQARVIEEAMLFWHRGRNDYDSGANPCTTAEFPVNATDQGEVDRD